MSSREKAQIRNWEDVPYGDYLSAVDDLLEFKYGRSSIQEELAYIAECQEASCTPAKCADSLILDQWICRN